MIKRVQKRLADGTIKIYEYENYELTKSQLDRKLRNQPGLVYFIQAASGPIKIGFTLDFPRRFRHLQQSTFEELKVLAVLSADSHLERRMLRLFKPDNIRGEWFVATERLLTEIRVLSRQFRMPKDLSKDAVERRLETAVSRLGSLAGK